MKTKHRGRNIFLSYSHGVSQSRLEIVCELSGRLKRELVCFFMPSQTKCRAPGWRQSPLGPVGLFSPVSVAAIHSAVGLTPLHPH